LTNLKKEGGRLSFNLEVQNLQKALQFLKYSLPKWGADGKFGNETESALRKFELANELEKDGNSIVVKVQKMKRTDKLPDLFLETVIQIILQEEARRLEAGFKVCPDIYEIGYNDKEKNFYIFQEKIDIELEKDFIYNYSKLKSKDFAEIFIEIAYKTKLLRKAL
jgi:peptidoglycan hydrolase-like protein with peptidoglycan-binding domain